MGQGRRGDSRPSIVPYSVLAAGSQGWHFIVYARMLETAERACRRLNHEPKTYFRESPRVVSREIERKKSNGIGQAVAELDTLTPESPTARRAISVFKKWLQDESGYDE